MTNATTQKRAIDFIASMANLCKGCLRHSSEACSDCPSRTAMAILRDIKSEEVLDLTLFTRCNAVTAVLRSAKRPLFAREIDLSRFCSPQLKLWTLKRMCELGIIGRKPGHRRGNYIYYKYFLKTKGDENNDKQ